MGIRNRFLIGIFSLSTFLTSFNSVIVASEKSNKDFYSLNESSEELKDQYLLGPGDVLNIEFFGAPEFTNEYRILKDGNISLPIVGNVNISNISIPKANLIIERVYSSELIRPDVLIKLRQPRPIRVVILGEVKNPGLYSLLYNTINQSSGFEVSELGIPTLIDAIQKAGGITDEADLKSVSLKRKLEEEGYFKKAKINLLSLLKEGDLSQNPYLYDGDFINIETSKVKMEDFDIISSNLTPKMIAINVIGQVPNPGKQIVSSNTTLSQAVLQAGGPLAWKGKKGNIRLIRFNQDGSYKTKKYSLRISKTGNDKSPRLADGDIVNVYPTNLEKVSTALETITRPISSFVQAYTLYKVLD